MDRGVLTLPSGARKRVRVSYDDSNGTFKALHVDSEVLRRLRPITSTERHFAPDDALEHESAPACWCAPVLVELQMVTGRLFGSTWIHNRTGVLDAG